MTNPNVAGEVIWLAANPSFKMRPASISEFCGPGYLNERNVRPGVMQALIDTFGEEVNPYAVSDKRRALLTGAIGIGKSTYAAIALSYMVHWIKCLKNPKAFYDLSEDSVIAFMMMSTTETLAQEVIFQKVKKRIDNSDWFQRHAPLDEAHKRLMKQMRFEGDVWIVPGSSKETSFEGYDILGGILDEGDSHTVTETKNNAKAGFDTIESRIESRFTDFYTGEHRGLVMVIGQAKTKSGFMMTKYKEFERDPSAVVVRMSLWESYGWHRYTMDKGDIARGRETSPRNSFYYNMVSRDCLSKEEAALVMSKDLIEVPMNYLKAFKNDPVKALRDLGGIPPEQEDPFFTRPEKILENQGMWHGRFNKDAPVVDVSELGKLVLPPWFSPGNLGGDMRRVIHLDLAYSADGDHLGLGMGHVQEKILDEDEEKAVIVMDLLLRLKSSPQEQIDFSKVRKFIYMLRDEYGFDIDLVTLDGFNSFEFMTQLRKNRIKTDLQSVDKTKAAYEDLRECMNDLRMLHPTYMGRLNPEQTETLNIVYKECSELQDIGKKIDHPKDGSKDLADVMAGVTHLLVSIGKYVREARTVESATDKRSVRTDSVDELFDVDKDWGRDSSGLAPDGGRQIVSFDEFKRATEGVLDGDLSFDFLQTGHGIPGYTRNTGY